jgi:hypothetical protein
MTEPTLSDEERALWRNWVDARKDLTVVNAIALRLEWLESELAALRKQREQHIAFLHLSEKLASVRNLGVAMRFRTVGGRGCGSGGL